MKNPSLMKNRSSNIVYPSLMKNRSSNIVYPCPSCGSYKSEKIAELSTKSLKELWRRSELHLDLTLRDFNCSMHNCEKCGLTYAVPVKLLVGNEDFYRKMALKEVFPSFKEEFAYIARLRASTGSVLDVGCGSGELGKLITGSYTGLDTSKEAAELGSGIVQETIEEHAKTNSGKYSLVVLSHILEHVEDPREFASYALTCLVKGGKLVVTVPNHNAYLRFLPNGFFNVPPNHVTWWTEESLNFLFVKILGLTRLDTFEEDLQDVHRRDYLEAYLWSLGFRVQPPWPLSGSWAGKIVKVMARALLPLWSFKKARKGHSITVLYEKGSGL